MRSYLFPNRSLGFALGIGVVFVTVGFPSSSEIITNAIAVTGGIIWMLGYLVMNYGVLMKAQRTQNVYYRMVAYPTWVEKKEKWERLYYCYTHDLVFDPCTGVSLLLRE